jgi:hypothetical protein
MKRDANNILREDGPDAVRAAADSSAPKKTVKQILAEADQAKQRAAASVSLDDFHAYMPMHSYIFAPSRELWPASSVNALIPPQPVRRLQR